MQVSKLVVTSPTFGEFRAGEPIAFRLAEKVLKNRSRSFFTTVGDDVITYDSEEQIIKVELQEYGVFTFHVSKV